MKLFIVRHGHADNGSSDSERSLTDFGREKLTASMKEWENHIHKIDMIFTSPYKRTLETAKVIHSHFKVVEKLIEDKSLMPGMNTTNVIDTLSTLELSNIMIVGHMPDVSELVFNLVADSPPSYPFNPGSLAIVEFKNELKRKTGRLKLFLQ